MDERQEHLILVSELLKDNLYEVRACVRADFVSRHVEGPGWMDGWMDRTTTLRPPPPPSLALRSLTRRRNDHHTTPPQYGKFLREAGQPSYFTEARLRLIGRQCLEALAFVHSLGLLHCDIKVRHKAGGISISEWTGDGEGRVSRAVHAASLHLTPPYCTSLTATKNQHKTPQPENIVIKSYTRVEVKLIDFGSSCFQTDHLSSYIQVCA